MAIEVDMLNNGFHIVEQEAYICMSPIEKMKTRNDLYSFLKNCKRKYKIPSIAFAEASGININTFHNFVYTERNAIGIEWVLKIKEVVDFFYSVEHFFNDKNTKLKDNKQLFLQLWHEQKQKT